MRGVTSQDVYRALRSINPSPYLFYFDYGNYKLFGSSPETHLKIQDGKAYINTIAGTFRRTGDDEKDKELTGKIATYEKENAEHIMLVDLARNDLSRHAVNIKVETYREVQFYSHVIHLVSEVSGEMTGNMTLKDATNEAMRYWISNPVDTYYIIGSVVGPHPYPDLVAKLQSVISNELKWQLREKTGKTDPDYIFACVGGGSNAIGSFYHYLDRKHVMLVAVEAAGKGIDTGESAATTFPGRKGVIHGSKTILMQNNDGQIIEPYSISAGLNYPGIGPFLAFLCKTRRVIKSITDAEALEAAFKLTLFEGIIPALETAHALAALAKIKFRKNDVVVVTISGRGDKDMAAYIHYMNDKSPNI